VGSHLLSLESVSKNITSCSYTRASSLLRLSNTSYFASSLFPIACPGIGIFKISPLVSTIGNTSFSLSAAIGALKLSGFIESSYVKRHYLTGLEYDTLPASTKVIFRYPQETRFLATWQPRDPDPSIKHEVFYKISSSNPGAYLHFISFKLRSAAFSTMLRVSN
jgi:hypothetical protein